jgi:hypothetical protein
MRGLRARKRGLVAAPEVQVPQRRVSVVKPPAAAAPAEPPASGACVAAVRADIAGVGELRGYQSFAAAAVAMGRILDDHRLATTAPSAAEQLASLLNMLNKSAAPKRGRLAVVQDMAPSSRPDAG